MSVVYLAVGSVTGTAKAVAFAVRDRLTDAGHQVVLDEHPGVAALNSSQCDALLICTSTTGHGDLPADMVPFYVELDEQFPLQNGRPFGVICLGDSSYDDTFGAAGIMMEERFLELQGSEPLPRITIDAIETVTPDDDALLWLEEWIQKALA